MAKIVSKVHLNKTNLIESKQQIRTLCTAVMLRATSYGVAVCYEYTTNNYRNVWTLNTLFSLYKNDFF